MENKHTFVDCAYILVEGVYLFQNVCDECTGCEGEREQICEWIRRRL